MQYEEINVPMDKINLDNKQYDFRKSISADAVARYAELNPEQVLEPILLLEQPHDAAQEPEYLVLSGRQRCLGWKSKEHPTVKARVYRDLSTADAILLAAMPNTQHGVPTTASERRDAFKAYLRALPSPSFPNVVDLAIKFGISQASAYKYKKEVAEGDPAPPPKDAKRLDELLRTIKYSPEQLKEITPADWNMPSRDRSSRIGELKAVVNDLQRVLHMAEQNEEEGLEIPLRKAGDSKST